MTQVSICPLSSKIAAPNDGALIIWGGADPVYSREAV